MLDSYQYFEPQMVSTSNLNHLLLVSKQIEWRQNFRHFGDDVMMTAYFRFWQFFEFCYFWHAIYTANMVDRVH